MVAAALIAALLGAVLQEPAATPPAPTLAELRNQLSAYEERAAVGRAEAADLVAIANAVLQRTLRSTNPHAVVHTCSSPFAPDADGCASKLWAIAKRPAVALEHRASAAAALAHRGDKDAASYLYGLVKGAKPAQLATGAFTLMALPSERAVPLLEAMLKSGDPAVQVAACRTLAQVDSGESRQVLSTYLAAAPKGTGPWFACTIAAGKLGDPEAQRTTRFITNHLGPDDLLAASEVLLVEDQELALSLLMQATRQSRGMPQLEAAERLAPHRPDIATDIMEHALSNGDPLMRAAALELHRTLQLEPSREVRGLLLDPNPLVQVRAAEAVLAWEARQRRAGR